MLIELLAIARDGDDLRVTFRSRIGNGVGRWRGRGAPDRGRYDVEIDLDVEFYEPPPIVDGDPAISHDGLTTTVRAIVELIDDNDVVCLRLANDGITSVEALPDTVTVGQTIEVRLPWRSLTLWPTGIDRPLR